MKGTRSYSVVILSIIAVFLMGAGRLSAVIDVPPAPPAQEAVSIEMGKEIIIHSKILGEDRPIMVYVPGDYPVSGASYPVLYLLDGSSHFHHATGVVDFLSERDRMPRMIVVGIKNIDRTRDFLPTTVNGIPPNAGADKFLSFLGEELIPFMDKNYRTVPYRILCGHSFGGLFGIYSLVNRHGLFQAHIIISPSVYWDDRLMFKKTGDFFKDNPGWNGFFYITAAGGDKEAIRFASKDFAGLLEKKAPKGFEWHYRFMEKEDHSSTVHRSFYDALETLYVEWWFSIDQMSRISLEDLREHYAKLSRKFGYQIPVTRGSLSLKEFLLLREDKIDEAIDVSKFRVAAYPGSALVHFELGRLYETAGKLNLAKTSFEKAVELAERNKDPRLPAFKKVLSILLKKMK